MKIGIARFDLDVQLPVEVIELIVSCIPQDDDRIFTLASCCLLSRDWYNVAIGPLYEAPKLTTRNFDRFATLMCPPVNSHARQTGLESLIRHLDMREIAYESTKSTTARLLRRTKANLVTFVGPAVSFSVSCLAPLSKCTKLQHVDLSRDSYDIDLAQLLRSVRNLPIRFLSLPRSIMRGRCEFAPAHSLGSSWPSTLTHLEVNECTPEDPLYWREFVESWPPTLTAVAFESIINWTPFLSLHMSGVVSPQIRKLRIGLRREEMEFPIRYLIEVFPSVTSLAIPIPMEKHPYLDESEYERTSKSNELTELELRKVPGVVRWRPFFETSTLAKYVRQNRKLRKIEVPDRSLLEDQIQSQEELNIAKGLLAARASNGEQSGVFLT